jgi:hypothetical protein
VCVLAVLSLLCLSAAQAAAQAAPEEDAAPAPAAREGPKTVPLPAPVDDVVPAGGGRYLLMRIDKLSKLAVYDVSADKIKGYVPLASADTLVAAGAEKLVVIARDKNVIQRWKLDPLEKELTVALVVGQVDSVAMGHASHGPVMVMTRTGPQFLALQTLKPIDVSFTDPNMINWWRSDGGQNAMQLAASADGQTFAGWNRYSSPGGLRLMRLQGDVATTRYEHNGAGFLLPSWDGSQLFTQQGVYSSDLKPLSELQFRQKICLPAYRPGYFLTLNLNDPFHNGQPNQAKPGTTLSVYTSSDRAMLVTLPPMPEVTQPRDSFPGNQGTLPWHDRVFLVPQHKRLVTVSDTRDQLVVRPFDIVATLNKAGIDYLFVDSLPVTVADPGKPYTYSIVVQSKKGGVKFSLDSAPEGMKVSKDGVLTWQVPADAEPGPTGIIVTIEDSAGQSVFHSFNVQIGAAPGRPGVGGARKIELGPDPNRYGYQPPRYPGNGNNNGQPPVVRAVRKPGKGGSSARTE